MYKEIDYSGIKWEYTERAFINFDNNVIVVYKKERPFTQKKHTIIVKDLFLAQDVLEVVENKIKKIKNEQSKAQNQKAYETWLDLQR